MMTIKEIFEARLPHYLCQLACHYTSNSDLNSKPLWKREPLMESFSWENTPQGWRFWFDVSKRYF